MPHQWIEAGGKFQVPFMAACQRLARGEEVICPKCGAALLRAYFHAFHSDGRGTLWAWCPNCRTKCHLPRVLSATLQPLDPFAKLSTEQFAELELNPSETFADRLDRMWNAGTLR
jgi:hypothetical protein